MLGRLRDASIVILATAGLWSFWSQYSALSALSWWYDNTQNVRARTATRTPDYDLATLPWKATNPRVFEVKPGIMTLATSGDPFGYQVFADISTGGAAAVDILFDGQIEAGGVTIGLLQGGKWIAIKSIPAPGAFADANSAQLGYQRSLTVMIANDNPAGESRLTIKSLQLFLRN